MLECFFLIKIWKVVSEAYGIIFILFVQDNFCGAPMWVSTRNKGAMIRKPGVGNDTIDRVGAVFVASHKAVRGKDLKNKRNLLCGERGYGIEQLLRNLD